MARRLAGSSTTASGARFPSRFRIGAALGTVYVVWGTTYLAIRVVDRTLPPLLAASVRFVVSGAVLLAIASRRRPSQSRPTAREWRAAAIVGALLLLLGNGGVVLAERTVPAGIVALMFAVMPLWMALIDVVVLRRRLRAPAALGLVIGFAGAALLVAQGIGGRIDGTGMLLAAGASLAWACGSLYARTAPLPAQGMLGTAMEMLCGGILQGLAGIALGELHGVDPSRFSTGSLVALGYLILVGSFVGFTTYLWLLRNVRTSLVSTYAYVNPLVAVVLGWLLLDETLGLRELAAAAMILSSVALIIRAGEVVPPPDAATGEDASESGAEALEERRAGREPEVLLEGAGDPQDRPLGEHRTGELEADG